MALLHRTVTPARLAANRHAALRSTGPRTTAGKLRSSLNAYRHGGRSRAMELVWRILDAAPVGCVIPMARRNMSPAQLGNPEVVAILNQFLAPGDQPLQANSIFEGRKRRGKFSPNEA